jgi:hypothetical protein
MDSSIAGKTILWTFSEGEMKDKSILHTFANDGTVTFQMMTGDAAGPASKPVKCESASIDPNVSVVSYRVDKGYTLTVVLNFGTKKLVAFSSNEKQLDMQGGTFEVYEGRSARTASSHAPTH